MADLIKRSNRFIQDTTKRMVALSPGLTQIELVEEERTRDYTKEEEETVKKAIQKLTEETKEWELECDIPFRDHVTFSSL